MRFSKLFAVVLGLVVALSGCSLFQDDDGDGSASSPSVDSGASPDVSEGIDGSATSDTLAAPRTDQEVLTELQGLYAQFGVQGGAELSDGIWVLRGTAPNADALSQFLGAARRIDGISVTRSQITVADSADSADMGESADGAGGDQSDGGAAAEDGAAESGDTATEDGTDAAAGVEDNADSLPRTGFKANLAVVALMLIAAGAFAVSTGRHLWLKAQLTNAFRIVPLNSTFTVERQPRSRRGDRRNSRR